MQPLIQIGQIGLDLVHVLALGACIGLGVCVYLLNDRRAGWLARAEQAEADLDATEQKLETQRRMAEEARLELAELRGQSAKDKEQFGEIARDVMAQAQKQFLDLAKENFEKHNQTAKGDLEKLVQPLGKNLEDFAKRVSEIEKVRAEDKSAIQEQVKAIGESLHRNTHETGKLVNALVAPKGGGRWGEMTLRNVMEQAGLSGHCDFNEQVHDQTEEGRQRPDAVIHLPGSRQIVVDSKVSLEAYMAAAATGDAKERAVHLQAHATSVQRHIDTLASKRYQSNLDERVDFVAMFIPGENFFAAALKHSPDLLERAYSRNVIVTTPSTLIGLAKTVAYVWRQEKMAENAREAAKLGEQLHERISILAGHMEKLGKSLNGAVDNYNKVSSSFDKRVLPTMRKFEELSIAAPDRTISEPRRIETTADTSTSLRDHDGDGDAGSDEAA